MPEPLCLYRLAAAILLLPAWSFAQSIRLSGVVVDDRQVPVQGATVRLTGDSAKTTGINGRFQFVDVVPGRYIITVTAVGQQLRSLDLTLSRDTSLAIVMTRRTVTLDTVVVRPRALRIKATAVDSATGDFLTQAQATLYPGGRFTGATSGVFVFDSVAPGPTTIVVEALEHLPTRVELNPSRDTTLVVRMGIDSVALRMTAIQVKRLEQRSHSIPMPTTSLNRAAIMRDGASSINELLIRRLYEDPVPVRRAGINAPDSGCFFLDDVKVSRSTYDGVAPETIERVEIFRSAGAEAPSIRGRPPGARNFGTVQMVRVYTRRFVATLPRQSKLPRILYHYGLGPTCT